MIKINVSPLGIKGKRTMQAKDSVRNVEASQLLQIKLLEIQDSAKLSELEPLDQIKKSREATHSMLDFVSATLKLSEEEADTVADNLDLAELSDFTNYLIFRIQGMTEEEWNLQRQIQAKNAEEETDENSKKD